MTLEAGRTTAPSVPTFQFGEENAKRRNSGRIIKPKIYCQFTAKSITSSTIDAISFQETHSESLETKLKPNGIWQRHQPPTKNREYGKTRSIPLT